MVNKWSLNYNIPCPKNIEQISASTNIVDSTLYIYTITFLSVYNNNGFNSLI